MNQREFLLSLEAIQMRLPEQEPFIAWLHQSLKRSTMSFEEASNRFSNAMGGRHLVQKRTCNQTYDPFKFDPWE